MFWIYIIIELPLGVGEIFCFGFQTHKGHWGMVCVYVYMCVCVGVCEKRLLTIRLVSLRSTQLELNPNVTCYCLRTAGQLKLNMKLVWWYFFFNSQASQKECNITTTGGPLLGLFWELGGVGRRGIFFLLVSLFVVIWMFF